MKTFITFLITAIFSIASAKSVYVSSFRAKVHSAQKSSSPVVMKVKKGTKLLVKSKSGSWLQVSNKGKQGWVKKIFTSSRKPGKKASLFASANKNVKVYARKRASSDVTAASARGLKADSVGASRARGVNQISQFDANDLKKIEDQKFSEDELLAFLKAENIL